jgi:hypothetical protein
MDLPTSNSAVVTAQWQLNETADSAIAIAKGVLKAATSDNVQPVAIIAADAFGATLAMCRETQMKVEQAARKNHTSYIVEFLKSSIGYAKDDCAIQLCSSSTGVRFLGLAAALLCTADTFTASQALELMITSSAGRGQILPTTTQLRDLLAALEYKLNRTGFAQSVLGWETFMTEHPEVPDELRILNRLTIDHPSVEALQAIVDGLRTLDRIGNTTSLQIKAGTCCPWVIAFIKWCLGEPPKIILEDGTVLIEQPHARVTVVAIMKPIRPAYNQKDATVHVDVMMMGARDVDFEISMYQDLKDPSQILTYSGQDQRPWFGMVPIEMYGRKRLREYDLLGNTAFYQAISHSIKLVTSKVQAHHPQHRPLKFGEADVLRSDDEWTGPLPETLSKYRTTMFPRDRDLKETLNKFLNHPENPNAILAELKDGQSIMSLPLVDVHMRALKEDCKCEACSGDLGDSLAECLKIKFTDILTQLTAEVIALSLFDTTEPILIYSGGARVPGVKSLDRNTFITAIEEILLGQASASCSAAEIVRLALDLIGHNAASKLGQRQWIASEARGQVVYPQIFDATILDTQAVLKLGGAPGKIFHDGSKFDLVLGGTGRQWDAAAKSKCWNERPVDSIVNLIPTEQLAWQVSKGDGTLHLACGTTNTSKVFNPHQILEALAQSMFLRSCSHPEDSILETSDAFSFYITPLYSNVGYNNFQTPSVFAGRIGVVAVAGNDGLRLLALACGKPGLIRGKACLQCCLDLCRQAGIEYIVL